MDGENGDGKAPVGSVWGHLRAGTLIDATFKTGVD